MLSNLNHKQGRSEGTSSVAFEVVTTNCELDFINLLIFNWLTSNINLFIFNCLTSNINLFNFNSLTSNYCLPKNIYFASRREWLFSCVFSCTHPGACYVRGTNKFLRYRTLFMSILKCGFPTKGIELTRFVLFEVSRCLSFEVSRLRPFR